MIPGEYILANEEITGNANRPAITVSVVNTGDRPVQVGSHFHFFEVNRQMAFDRAKAFGRRLDIPAGTAVRFEPGEEKDVPLVAFGGEQQLHGFSGLLNGLAAEEVKEAVLNKAAGQNFKTNPA